MYDITGTEKKGMGTEDVENYAFIYSGAGKSKRGKIGVASTIQEYVKVNKTLEYCK